MSRRFTAEDMDEAMEALIKTFSGSFWSPSPAQHALFEIDARHGGTLKADKERRDAERAAEEAAAQARYLAWENSPEDDGA